MFIIINSSSSSSSNFLGGGLDGFDGLIDRVLRVGDVLGHSVGDGYSQSAYAQSPYSTRMIPAKICWLKISRKSFLGMRILPPKN